MPVVEIIDLRNEKLPLGGLSETLRQAMIQALEAGGQVILLLNRRGFHTFVLCPKCGNVVKCRACDVAATYHKERHILICHTCDAERLPVGLPILWRDGIALRGHRHRAARARDQARVSRRGVAADGLRYDALSRQPRAGARRRSAPARSGSCWEHR